MSRLARSSSSTGATRLDDSSQHRFPPPSFIIARLRTPQLIVSTQELKTVDAADEEAPSSSSSSSSPAAAADMWELVVDGMEHAVMVEFVRYLYTDRVSPDLEDRLLVLLCVVAERFHLSRYHLVYCVDTFYFSIEKANFLLRWKGIYFFN